MREELLQKAQYKNNEEREELKNYFTQPPDMDMAKKTIVFSTPSETGTSFFRLFEPMKALWKAFPDEANYLYTENIQPNHMKIADTIIMHRCGNLHSHFLSVARMWPRTERRPLIIHDADDNEFNLPDTHPMKELWIESGKDKMSIQSLKHSDFITTTTEKLKRTFGNFNDNVDIFRNQFDWDLPMWNLDKNEARKEMLSDWFPTDDKIIIGWAGLTSHFEDIRRMHAIIKAIHDKYPNTYFVLAGMALKDSHVEITEDEKGNKQFKEVEIEDESMLYKNRIQEMYNDIDPKRFKTFDALPLEEYAKFNALFDISLAYVEHSAFSSCKSEIKVIEALHYGAIPVFSEFGGYKDFWRGAPDRVRHKNMAIGIQSPGPWIKAVSHWVENFEEGKKRAATLKEYSDDIYDINKHCEERLQYYLEKSEDFKEAQINMIAQYVDYSGE